MNIEEKDEKVELEFPLINENSTEANQATKRMHITKNHRPSKLPLQQEPEGTDCSLQELQFLVQGSNHDINNVLTALYYTILKLQESEPTKEQSSLLKLLDKQAEIITNLNNQIIDVLSQKEMELMPISIIDFINPAIELFKLNSNDICTIIPENIWQVKGDSQQLIRVIYNLLLNAKQATCQSDLITISAKNTAIKLDNNILKQMVAISVTDKGSGICPKNIGKLFQASFSSKNGHHGLGLYIVNWILIKHKGMIKVESEPDKGSTFTFFLPAVLSF